MTRAYIFDIFLANLEGRLEPNEAYLVKSSLAAGARNEVLAGVDGMHTWRSFLESLVVVAPNPEASHHVEFLHVMTSLPCISPRMEGGRPHAWRPRLVTASMRSAASTPLLSSRDGICMDCAKNGMRSTTCVEATGGDGECVVVRVDTSA
jgi:hypothetical protein